MLLSIFLYIAPCLAVSGAKPQMGWNSWNTFHANISEDLIKSTAQKLVSAGFQEAGYSYVLLDEGWQATARDAEGRQQPDATKFPGGIGPLADYIHNLGLKIGIYSDAGIYDCGFYPGSFGYEELDAASYANWGIDYLKYDHCGGFASATLPVQERFWRMASALDATGRDIFYSLCEWGSQLPWYWADQFSGSYRISGDIKGSFAADSSGVCQTAYCLNTGYAGVSVLTMIRKMRELSRFQKPGAWGDMDMLEIGTGTMNEFEEQTHFAFWAALKSPLIIGADVRNLNQSSLDIMLNKEIIAISQDDAKVAVNYLPDISTEGKFQIWSGPLSSGTSRQVILALNYGAATTNITIPLSGIPGLSKCTAPSYTVRDVWAAQDLGTLGSFGSEIVLVNVSSHQTKVLVLSSP